MLGVELPNPLALEVGTLLRRGTLLEQGIPVARTLRALFLLEVPVDEPLGPHVLARLAAKRVVAALRLGGNAYDVPHLAVLGADGAGLPRVVVRQDPAGDVIFMPSCLDMDYEALRLHAGPEVRDVRLPNLVALHHRVGGLVALDQVVAHRAVGTMSRNPAEDTAGVILRAVAQYPVVDGLRLAADPVAHDPEELGRLYNVTAPTPKLLGQIGAVGGTNQRAPRTAPQEPRREQH